MKQRFVIKRWDVRQQNWLDRNADKVYYSTLTECRKAAMEGDKICCLDDTGGQWMMLEGKLIPIREDVTTLFFDKRTGEELGEIKTSY